MHSCLSVLAQFCVRLGVHQVCFFCSKSSVGAWLWECLVMPISSCHVL